MGWGGSDGDFGMMFFGADGELLGGEKVDYTPSFLRDVGQSGQMSVRVCRVWGGGWVRERMVGEWVRNVGLDCNVHERVWLCLCHPYQRVCRIKSVRGTSVCARACICLCVCVCGWVGGCTGITRRRFSGAVISMQPQRRPTLSLPATKTTLRLRLSYSGYSRYR